MNLEYKFDNISLRILDKQYASMILAFCNRNKEIFEHYEIDKPLNFYTLAFQEKLVEAEYNGFLHGTYVRFYMFDNNISNKIIGTISFSDMKRNAFFSCQIGYKIDSNYVNQGYGFKMLSNSIRIMESECHMHRIGAYILPGNMPSIKLVEKVGFELEGIAKSYVLMNNKWTDHLSYAYIATQN